MKVLLINGSPHQFGCTYTALSEIQKTLSEQNIESEIYWIGNKPIAGCIGCGTCRKIGNCVQDDQVNKLGSMIDEIDGLVLGSPVYFAGPSGSLQCVLDRLFYAHGKKLADKVGACVVSCRRGGATAAFDRLNKYLAIENMYIVGSQYWNQVHGNKPEDVMQDVEGLQTMRTLALNIAQALKAKELTKDKLEPVLREKQIKTNFIR